jgi:preprotein translocase subunit SecE
LAKTSPGEFIRQVRAETAKVHWPTRKETVATAIMVIIMTLALAFFFFGVDAFFSTLVRFLLGFLAKKTPPSLPRAGEGRGEGKPGAPL